MKIFIWESVENATSNYHSGGGVMVVAESLERATELAGKEGVTFGQYDTLSMEYELAGTPDEKVVIFPDAGCC